MKVKPTNIDAYIALFSDDKQAKLQQMRNIIKTVAPQAEEAISYGIPAFRLNGMLVWFAAFSNHIGLYPRGSGIEEFKEELKGFSVSKGTIRFPLDKPLPSELIENIVKFRVAENNLKSRKLSG